MEKKSVSLEFGNSPETQNSEDMDFNDVFGGPPRRFSMQEVKARYSFGETVETEEASPWSEKPVFGEETTPRRRRHGGDFFDDIFKGGGETYSSPRRSDSLFGSNPGSRIMSPSRPLPPKSDPFATSLPPQFSLPAKLNGLNSSRFWEAQPVGPLSSFIIEDTTPPSSTVMFDSNHFHFSIYKWAGRGEPMLMPFVNLKAKYDYKYASQSQDLRREEEKKLKSERAESVKPLHHGHKPVKLTEMKERETKNPQGHELKNVKEKQVRGFDSKNTQVEEFRANNLGGSRVGKGKVKEFVQIFNQEVDSDRNRNSRERNEERESEVSRNAAQDKEEQVKLHDSDKKPDVSFKVDTNLNNEETQQYSAASDRFSTNPQKIFSSEKLHTDSKIPVENSDDPLEDNFLVEELSDAHENVTQSESSQSDDTKAIDAKIQQWSVGKKGNIRSLLSTLQYVLWAESGWKAVPLVDLIEANAVKRAYQKALLRLHPDKLQQKGAAFHHKYIAQKVFDILQEAWDHFNTCSLTM